MSSPERRKEMRRQAAEEDRARSVEEARYRKLTTWERIEELNVSRELKDILHAMDEKLVHLEEMVYESP